MKKTILFLCLALASLCAHADQVQIDWSYDQIGPLSIFGPDGVTPLSGAGTSANGDGFVLQLGYYTLATSSDPFQGAWVPLYGPGALNTSLFSTAGMGDFTTGSGTTGDDDRFNLSGAIDTTDPGTSTGIPSAGQIMAIRYYNAASLSSATYFGTASNSLWTWVSPSTPPPPEGMIFNIADNGVVYEGGATEPVTNMVMTEPVPEPATLSSFLVGGIALGALALRRRRA